jgi:hypothetical protein
LRHDPVGRHDLLAFPGAVVEHYLPGLQQVAWPHSQAGGSYRFAGREMNPVLVGDFQRCEQIGLGEAVERLSGGLVDCAVIIVADSPL